LTFLLSGYPEGDREYLSSEIIKAGGKIIAEYPWKKKIDDEIKLKEKKVSCVWIFINAFHTCSIRIRLRFISLNRYADKLVQITG
jgi:hypothetical protein